MNDSNKVDYHFIDLKGVITGGDQQPAPVTEHRSLSLNTASVNKLLATRSSGNTGEPLAATTPPLMEKDAPREERPLHINSLVLGVDFSLPSCVATVEAVEPDAAPQAEEDVQACDPDQDLHFDLPSSQESVEASEADAVPQAEHDASVSDPDQVLHPELNTSVETVEAVSPEAAPHPGQPIHAEPAPEDVNETLEYLAELGTEPGEEDRATIAAGQVPLDPEDALNFRVNIASALQAEQQALPYPRPNTEDAVVPAPPKASVGDSDTVLGDVQSTLDALADMAKGLTQQKLEAVKQQEGLDQRKAQLYEKERLLADKEEQLRLLETRLTREVSNLERTAEDNARALAERSAALKALAETVEARDRSTAKFAETLRQEKQRNDELAESLQRRADALDEREASLNRKDDELAEKLKQLISTKERFRKIVKAFNETVQFNDTLNAISSTALDDNQH